MGELRLLISGRSTSRLDVVSALTPLARSARRRHVFVGSVGNNRDARQHGGFLRRYCGPHQRGEAERDVLLRVSQDRDALSEMRNSSARDIWSRITESHFVDTFFKQFRIFWKYGPLRRAQLHKASEKIRGGPPLET